MKILVITNISILQFYGYVGYILVDILKKKILIGLKLIKIHRNVRKTL